ncbi:dimethylarginine dimethylaminohydrolase family protein [Polyangium aurulentum]|uniref:dimethylarginine dimethylaminohydrolase family protein n=1 Tax=Polyangium aurulentum TaxID=2567896 RepID=UPI001F35F858|nr:amidinotransferase [Polyangium aurulentum]
MIDLYLMSPPSPGWALRGRANFRSQNAPAVDAAAARREWLALAEAIEARGGTVIALEPPSDELSGMPYAAECGHVIAREGAPPLFVLPRMAKPHRQGERAHWQPLAEAMGLEVVDPGEGIWEAQGDVAELDGCTLLFHGGRTDRAGMEAAARFFPGETLAIEIREPAFHGNMAVLPLPSVDRMLVCREVLVGEAWDALVRRFGEARLLPVTEAEIREYATNGLPVGDTLLAPSLVPDRVARLVESLGMRVERLPLRELCDKAGGASRCLVSRARVDEKHVRLPEENRLAKVAAAIRGESLS